MAKVPRKLHCPKCGRKDATLDYCGPGQRKWGCTEPATSSKEHFHRTCGTCSFFWTEEVPEKGDAASERCPTCDSPSRELHPAVQHEGEVQVCRNPWHGGRTDSRRLPGDPS